MTTEVVAIPPETCIECGFDSARWSRQDAIRTVEKAGWLVGLAVERLPDEIWLARSDPATWAVGEYVDHLADVMVSHRRAVEASVETPGTDVGHFPEPPVPAEVPRLDPTTTLARLEREAGRHGALLRSIDDEVWANAVTAEGEILSLDWGVRHSAHEVMHHLRDIARLRHRLGDVLGPIDGTVASLHASDGGVPKASIPSAEIDVGGLVGDRQASRQYHGRPWQALCLWSAEVVDAWAAEGHPIFPGAAGENLNLSGLDWSQLRPGLIVEIGSMTAQISAPAIPCAKNSRWFTDGSPRRLGHDVSPGRARWYASVLTPGRVDQGDAVAVRSGD